MNSSQQRGSTLMGLIIGLVVGLGVALAVALYVSKVPLPFKGGHSPDTPSQDNGKDKDWNPNSVLQPKAAASTPSAPASDAAVASPPAPPAPAPAPAAPPAASSPPAAPSAPAVSADPLGAAKTGLSTAPATPQADAFQYFVQVGAYRTPAEADAQKARVALLGMDAKVSERDQSGRPVYRVRLGPFDDRDSAERIRTRLADNKLDTALVRVQR